MGAFQSPLTAMMLRVCSFNLFSNSSDLAHAAGPVPNMFTGVACEQSASSQLRRYREQPARPVTLRSTDLNSEHSAGSHGSDQQIAAEQVMTRKTTLQMLQRHS